MRWSRNLLVRLLAPYLFALLAVAASLYAYSDQLIEDLYLATLSDEVLQQARLAAAWLPWELRGTALDQHCAAVAAETGARVTVIAADGTVLGDSAAPSATLANHRDRPEVLAASASGDGSDVRLSASIKRSLFYRAWRQTRAAEVRVIRLAVPMATIDQARHRIRVAIWGGVGIAALAALWPALLLSRRLSQRVGRLTEFSQAITEGRPPPPLRPTGDDLVARLEANVLAMARSLGTQLQTARDEQGKLSAILGGMVEAVLVADHNGTIELANQRAAQLFAPAPASTLVGQPLIHLSRDPDLRALIRAVLSSENRGPLVREIVLETAAGREEVQVTAAPLAEARRFILVFHDVTTMKKLEATRRDFVANVSHELRTPLTAIHGYAETLRTGAADNPELARKFAAIIERHSQRLGRLTDDLLTLSDLELGRTPMHRSAVLLAPAVAAAIELVREKAAEGQVTIRNEIPAQLPPLAADPDRLQQLLLNLLDNAVKYTPADGSVTVRAQSAPPPAGDTTSRSGVELVIADTGIGIPSHDLPRLTERFYRVDKARSRELGGTGLGLAIVKHIVQAHGGRLAIESELGHGTCVRVTLPASGGGV